MVLQSIDVATVNAFRFLSSFVLLGTYLASRRQLPTIKQLRATSPVLMLVAIGGLTCNYLFFTKGLIATSPSHAEVLIQLAHLFFGFGGLLIFKETYSRKQLVGLGILVLGLVGFFNQQLTVVAATEKYWAGSAMLAFGSKANVATAQLWPNYVDNLWLLWADFWGFLSSGECIGDVAFAVGYVDFCGAKYLCGLRGFCRIFGSLACFTGECGVGFGSDRYFDCYGDFGSLALAPCRENYGMGNCWSYSSGGGFDIDRPQ